MTFAWVLLSVPNHNTSVSDATFNAAKYLSASSPRSFFGRPRPAPAPLPIAPFFAVGLVFCTRPLGATQNWPCDKEGCSGVASCLGREAVAVAAGAGRPCGVAAEDFPFPFAEAAAGVSCSLAVPPVDRDLLISLYAD